MEHEECANNSCTKNEQAVLIVSSKKEKVDKSHLKIIFCLHNKNYVSVWVISFTLAL